VPSSGTLTCGRDVEIDVNCIFEGRVVLGDGVKIGAHCILRDVTVGEATEIRPFSLLEEASVGANARIGPYARIRPGTDDKVLTAWNGLMLAAFAESARVLAGSSPHSHTHLDLATRSAEFLVNNLRVNGKLHRSWRNGQVTEEVFLEDYAALILGLLELYQTDFNNKWFTIAHELTDEMIEKFSNPDGGFFDTPHTGETLLFRPKDISDNATPSGNALACEALLKMAAYTDQGSYRSLAEQSLALIGESILRYPLGFARWLSAAENALGTMKQIAVLGEAGEENFERLLKVIRAEYRPGVVVAASSHPPSQHAPALLENRPLLNGKATVYVCEGFVCKQPTNEIEVLIAQLKA